MIVMELARGGELSDYLEKTGKMTEDKAKGRSTGDGAGQAVLPGE